MSSKCAICWLDMSTYTELWCKLNLNSIRYAEESFDSGNFLENFMTFLEVLGFYDG